MKLAVRHTYTCSPERYWEMYWDEAFDEKQMAESSVTRELIEETDEGGVHTRKLRFTSNTELPTIVAKALGTKTFTYEQINRFVRAESRMDWEVLPTFLSSDKFTAAGTFAVTPTSDGCALSVDGDIEVKIRFIGGQIEKQVVAQIEDAYARMHQASLEWLDENGTSAAIS